MTVTALKVPVFSKLSAKLVAFGVCPLAVQKVKRNMAAIAIIFMVLIGCSLRPGLATWRYSVLRKLGLVLIKDMKMKIYSIAGIYSSD